MSFLWIILSCITLKIAALEDCILMSGGQNDNVTVDVMMITRKIVRLTSVTQFRYMKLEKYI